MTIRRFHKDAAWEEYVGRRYCIVDGLGILRRWFSRWMYVADIDNQNKVITIRHERTHEMIHRWITQWPQRD